MEQLKTNFSKKNEFKRVPWCPLFHSVLQVLKLDENDFTYISHGAIVNIRGERWRLINFENETSSITRARRVGHRKMQDH